MRLRVASVSCQAHHHHALHALAHVHAHTQKGNRATSPLYLTVLVPLLSDWLVHRCASFSLCLDEKIKDHLEKGGVKHGNPSKIIVP